MTRAKGGDDGQACSISYVRFIERVHLLRPVDLDLRDIFSRERHIEVLVIVWWRHDYQMLSCSEKSKWDKPERKEGMLVFYPSRVAVVLALSIIHNSLCFLIKSTKTFRFGSTLACILVFGYTCCVRPQRRSFEWSRDAEVRCWVPFMHLRFWHFESHSLYDHISRPGLIGLRYSLTQDGMTVCIEMFICRTQGKWPVDSPDAMDRISARPLQTVLQPWWPITVIWGRHRCRIEHQPHLHWCSRDVEVVGTCNQTTTLVARGPTISTLSLGPIFLRSTPNTLISSCLSDKYDTGYNCFHAE